MISDKHRCIFVHVPKCAGESIETVFLGGPFNISEYEGHPEKHWGVKEISKTYPDKYAAYFSFSVVRNPWDRVVSWVRYRDKRWGRASGKFENRLWDDLNDDRFVRYMLKHSYANLLLLGDRVAVDSVIRMENLQEGFNTVCNELGMGRVRLPHHNKTKHGIYTDYYNDRSRKKVDELFNKDIQLFGYTFE